MTQAEAFIRQVIQKQEIGHAYLLESSQHEKEKDYSSYHLRVIRDYSQNC